MVSISLPIKFAAKAIRLPSPDARAEPKELIAEISSLFLGAMMFRVFQKV
jgi:hypothetical protein